MWCIQYQHRITVKIDTLRNGVILLSHVAAQHTNINVIHTDSALICRCTDEERIWVGRLAQHAGMTVSAYVRMAVVQYSRSLIQQAADRSAADMAIRESAEA